MVRSIMGAVLGVVAACDAASAGVTVLARTGQQASWLPAGFVIAPTTPQLGAGTGRLRFTSNGGYTFYAACLDPVTQARLVQFVHADSPGGALAPITLATPTVQTWDGLTTHYEHSIGTAGQVYSYIYDDQSYGLRGYAMQGPFRMVHAGGVLPGVYQTLASSMQYSALAYNPRGNSTFVAGFQNNQGASLTGVFYDDGSGLKLSYSSPRFVTEDSAGSVSMTNDGRVFFRDGNSIVACGSVAPRVVIPGVGALPGIPGSNSIDKFVGTRSGFATHRVALSGDGHFAAAARVKINFQPNKQALFGGTIDNVQLIALEGQQAPGLPSGVKYGTMEVFGGDGDGTATAQSVIADGGRVAFRTMLTGSAVSTINDTAVFAGSLDAPELIAREGDPAIGAAPGLIFDDIAPVAINNSGQVLLTAKFENGVDDSWVGAGLYLHTPGAGLIPALVVGQYVELAPGDVRRIVSIDPATGDPSAVSTLSEDGRVATLAGFDDGTVATIIVQVPAPGTCSLMGVVFLLGAKRRRRIG